MATILEMRQVLLQRGPFQLKVDNLQLSAGRLYALKGDNGAGKSTLLQLLALLDHPTAGSIVFDGHQVRYSSSALKAYRRRITLMEQNPWLFSGTVADNLAFGLKLRGINGRKRRVAIDEALEATGLQGFSRRPAHELSGGESRRVALARALVVKPDVLLLDEPTASLDSDQVAAMERFLVALPEQGITVVIATHDQQQPQRLGGEMINLCNGEVRQRDSKNPPCGYQPILRKVSA